MKVADGAQVWQTNVMKACDSRSNLRWGIASTPLIIGDVIYVQSGADGNVAAAVNKNDGTILWKSEAVATGGYAHPVMIEVAGGRQLIIYGGDEVYGMNPDDGKTLWSIPW